MSNVTRTGVTLPVRRAVAAAPMSRRRSTPRRTTPRTAQPTPPGRRGWRQSHCRPVRGRTPSEREADRRGEQQGAGDDEQQRVERLEGGLLHPAGHRRPGAQPFSPGLLGESEDAVHAGRCWSGRRCLRGDRAGSGTRHASRCSCRRARCVCAVGQRLSFVAQARRRSVGQAMGGEQRRDALGRQHAAPGRLTVRAGHAGRHEGGQVCWRSCAGRLPPVRSTRSAGPLVLRRRSRSRSERAGLLAT